MTDIPAEAVEDVPSFGTGVDTDYILGIGKSEERSTSKASAYCIAI